ncbi:MAG TPA: DUF997 family protein [Pirellulaceae bacterium]|nr:DUF997 family protein [Pirellulaceae bacterium]
MHCALRRRPFAIGASLWHIACTPPCRFPTDLMSNPYEVYSSDAPPPATRAATPDPILQSAWREALTVFGTWGVALVWSFGYCAWFAYPGRDNMAEAAGKLTYVFGFPSWVFWGIVLPWLCCVAASFVLSRFVITDADLGMDPDEAMREIIGEEGDA